MKIESQQIQNKEKRATAQWKANANFLNSRPAATASIKVTHNDEYELDEHTPYSVTYSLINVRIWNPITQCNELPAEDKFQVTATDFQTAKFEFWRRWSIYSMARFNISSIPVSFVDAPAPEYIDPRTLADTQRKTEKITS